LLQHFTQHEAFLRATDVSIPAELYDAAAAAAATTTTTTKNHLANTFLLK
jgi:hypothetical protein